MTEDRHLSLARRKGTGISLRLASRLSAASVVRRSKALALPRSAITRAFRSTPTNTSGSPVRAAALTRGRMTYCSASPDFSANLSG